MTDVYHVITITIGYIQSRQGFECYHVEEELTKVHNYNYGLFNPECQYCDWMH